jgi:hypothetical protein
VLIARLFRRTGPDRTGPDRTGPDRTGPIVGGGGRFCAGRMGSKAAAGRYAYQIPLDEYGRGNGNSLPR